jgi:hypothetical protein
MKEIFKNYLLEVAKLTYLYVNAIVFGTIAGVFLFTTLFVFATLYGWQK